MIMTNLLSAVTSSSSLMLIVGGLAIILGFLIIFPLFWCFVVLMISRMGDWHRLAAHYAAGDRAPSGTVHNGVFGMVGKARYKFALTVHTAPDGLFLETSPLFRIGHPRLFIPWNAVTGRDTRQIQQWQTTVLTIGQPIAGRIALALPQDALLPLCQ